MGSREEGSKVETLTAGQGTGKQLRQIPCLFIALDGAEHQLDGPLGGHALRLQRVGQSQATDHQVRPGRSDPLQLAVHMLPFTDGGGGGQLLQFSGHEQAIQVGGPHLLEDHAALLVEETGQGNFQLGIRQQKQPLALQLIPVAGHRRATPLPGCFQVGLHRTGGQAKGPCSRLNPGGGALHPQRVRGSNELCAPRLQGPGSGAQIGLTEQDAGVGTHGR